MVETEKKQFAESDLQRIKNIAFQLEYLVDIELHRINVPEKKLEEAGNNSLVLRLIREYGFVVQSSIA